MNYENLIRDNLAQNLHILSADYELIGTEHYIPESQATKSFIDILAKDKENNYIIIEVKRSNQAARQAIHEIYKYVEAVKNYYKVTSGEVRALIVSTEWKELFVPFSAFANESNISIEGYEIITDDSHTVVSASKIKPCKTSMGRVFSANHNCCLYLNEENLQKGIVSHNEIFKDKGFNDYVLVILKAAEINEAEYKKSLAEMFSEMMGDSCPDYAHFDKMELHPFMIYSAYQRLDLTAYHDILQRNKYLHEETLEFFDSLETISEEDMAARMEQHIFGSVQPYFYSDSSESGYPAKFAHKIIEDEGWEILRIERSASLKENRLLTDEKILSEIKGKTGITNTVFEDSCLIGHTAKVAEIKSNAINALKHNDVWRNHVKLFFEEIEEMEDYELHVEIFNPSHILLTLTHIVIHENLENYLPRYIIRAHKKGHEKVFVGTFSWNGISSDFKSIIDTYFHGDPANLIMTLAWGGFDVNNEAILNDLGLTFESHICEQKPGVLSCSKFVNFRLRQVESIENGIPDFIEAKPDFVMQLANAYRTYYFEVKV